MNTYHRPLKYSRNFIKTHAYFHECHISDTQDGDVSLLKIDYSYFIHACIDRRSFFVPLSPQNRYLARGDYLIGPKKNDVYECDTLNLNAADQSHCKGFLTTPTQTSSTLSIDRETCAILVKAPSKHGWSWRWQMFVRDETHGTWYAPDWSAKPTRVEPGASIRHDGPLASLDLSQYKDIEFLILEFKNTPVCNFQCMSGEQLRATSFSMNMDCLLGIKPLSSYGRYYAFDLRKKATTTFELNTHYPGYFPFSECPGGIKISEEYTISDREMYLVSQMLYEDS